MTRQTLFAAALLAATNVYALLPEPDFLLFGTVTGTPPWLEMGNAVGMNLDVRDEATGTLLANAVIDASGHYVLRIPIDSVDPQAPRTSRPGRPLDLFLSGVQLDPVDAIAPLFVPDTGERGSYYQLDIDLDSIVTGPGFFVFDAEALQSAGVVNVRIRLEGETDGITQSVNWLTVGSTAKPASGSLCAPGDDYVPASGIANFAPGQTLLTVPIQLCHDNVLESPRSFLVRLVNPSNGIALVRPEATVTIIDDDGIPALSINNIVVREPQSGTASAVFQVALSAPQSTPVTFNYATENRTALAGVNYAAIEGVASIPSGMTGTELVVDVLANSDSDDGKTFALVLTNPTGAHIAVSEGIARIIDAANEGTVIVDDGDGQLTLDGPIDLAAHPSGSWLYVANQLGKTISRFDIDPANGRLSNELSWGEFELSGAKLDGLVNITASSDGKWLIAAVSGGGAEGLNLLAVDSNGFLSFAGLARNAALDARARPFEGLNDISAVSVSPDSAHLYVVSRAGNSVATLSLSGDIPPYMIELEQNGVNDPLDTGGEVRDMEGPSDVIVSKDGRSVHVTSPVSSAIVHFSRDTDPQSNFYGQLTFRESYSQTSMEATALNGVLRLANSADGQQLYAVSPETGKLTALKTGINGELTHIGSQETDEPGTLASASAVLASPDSQVVFVASPSPGSLHVFRRLSGGNVAALQVLIADRDADLGLRGASALAQVPARPKLLYVAAFEDNRVAIFEIGMGSDVIFRDRFAD